LPRRQEFPFSLAQDNAALGRIYSRAALAETKKRAHCLVNPRSNPVTLPDNQGIYAGRERGYWRLRRMSAQDLFLPKARSHITKKSFSGHPPCRYGTQ
jgi:hypothetical protein